MIINTRKKLKKKNFQLVQKCLRAKLALRTKVCNFNTYPINIQLVFLQSPFSLFIAALIIKNKAF